MDLSDRQLVQITYIKNVLEGISTINIVEMSSSLT